MRYVFRFGFALALGLALMAGCSDSEGTGGVGGDGGTAGVGGGTVACVDGVCPCTIEGIHAAIAEGGGPFTFRCEGPATVVATESLDIKSDVILDGEGRLTVDGDGYHGWMAGDDAIVELRGLAFTNGFCLATTDAMSALIVRNCTVSASGCSSFGTGPVVNVGTMTLTNSTVSGNARVGRDHLGGGIWNLGTMLITNSTVSGNTASAGGGILNEGTMTITNSTVSGNEADPDRVDGISNSGTVTLTNTLVNNDCAGITASGGGNIESPGDTCGFDQPTDQVNVNPDDLNLGPLADNGGPTETHALLPGSVAIDAIPEADCVDADDQPLTTDQRGEPRPETGGTMCDVGAFEVTTPCTGLRELSPCGEDFSGTCYAGICLPFGSDGCAEVEEGAKCFGFNYQPDYNKDVYVGFCVVGSCVPACLVLDDGAECTDPYFSGVGVCRDGHCRPSG